MASIRKGVSLAIGIGVLPVIVFAQASDTSIIRTQVGSDTAPPTIPGNFTATPVTTTQINLAWDASTDNFGVSGYQVFRDAAFLATTTVPTYSDSGLTPSTTYSYTVRAFDDVSNFSTSTAAVATTTLPVVVAPTSTPTTTSVGSGGTSAIITLTDLSIFTTTDTADVSWETNRTARYTIRWGRTIDYELGFVSSELFAREHQTQLQNLAPGTTYEYELIAIDYRERERVLSRGQFTTDLAPDTTPPPNVSDLTAVVVDDSVVLTWQNPAVADFDRVRILRSHLFYPLHPNDGFLVYEGTGSGVRDERAFLFEPGQYYTVFTYDTDGNVSSGAVVYVEQERGVTLPTRRDSTPSTTPPKDVNDTPPLSASAIWLLQDGKRIVPESSQSEDKIINGAKPLTVSIPYEALPEHLKTIRVTFTHPDDAEQVFTFLLRINEAATAYEATIAPLGDSGRYGLIIEVIDFETSVVSQVTDSFVVAPLAAPAPTEPSTVWFGLRITLIAILLLIVWFLVARRRRPAEDR